MLQLSGPSQSRFCDGVSRRGFLQIGALGAGVTLADMLRLKARAAERGQPTRQKSAIMIYLPGGPSHMDMYDLKPDAPVEFRGEFSAIPTAAKGVQISEHFPMQAKLFDKMAVIRSIVSTNEHSDSLVMTGTSQQANRVANHPSFGSVVSRTRGQNTSAVPPFVSLRGTSTGTEPGFLGIAHRPFTPGGAAQANLRIGTSTDAMHERKNLLDSLDDVKRDIDASGTMSGMDQFSQQALEMITGGKVRQALDLSKEDAKTRERYKGVEQFLTARRLIEAGVGCVTLSVGGWDTHSNNFASLKKQLPLVDRAVANLIGDLVELGLHDDCVTIMWGEFGRTPKINTTGGRDHWPSVMSAMVSGGGLKMGQAVGSSSARGETPKDSPYTPSQVLSTLYRTVGIDPSKTFPNGSGRPVYVLDEREPVKELL